MERQVMEELWSIIRWTIYTPCPPKTRKQTSINYQSINQANLYSAKNRKRIVERRTSVPESCEVARTSCLVHSRANFSLDLQRCYTEMFQGPAWGLFTNVSYRRHDVRLSYAQCRVVCTTSYATRAPGLFRSYF